jgi:hypothetical protein
MPDQQELSRLARRVWSVVEPLASSVYFSPEAHKAYEELGFAGSPHTSSAGVTLPDRAAYFTSRGACLGQVPGEVIAAAFAVFNPAVVGPAVAEGWGRTDPSTILEARLRGATGQLRRILGDEPNGLARATEILRRAGETAGGEGRHLYSGLRSLGFPGDPMGDFWRAADLVREHRGDSHIAAWISAGLDAVEIGLITDLWRGLAIKSWVRTRGWSDEQLDAGIDRLRGRGLLEGDELTTEGQAFREQIEVTTDLQERAVVEAIDGDADELFGLMEPWARAVIEAGGYPGGASALMRQE